MLWRISFGRPADTMLAGAKIHACHRIAQGDFAIQDSDSCAAVVIHFHDEFGAPYRRRRTGRIELGLAGRSTSALPSISRISTPSVAGDSAPRTEAHHIIMAARSTRATRAGR